MSKSDKAAGAAEPATSPIGVAVLGLGNVGSEVVPVPADPAAGEVRRKPAAPRDVPAARPLVVDLPDAAVVVAGVRAEPVVRAYAVGVVTVAVRLDDAVNLIITETLRPTPPVAGRFEPVAFSQVRCSV